MNIYFEKHSRYLRRTWENWERKIYFKFCVVFVVRENISNFSNSLNLFEQKFLHFFHNLNGFPLLSFFFLHFFTNWNFASFFIRTHLKIHSSGHLLRSTHYLYSINWNFILFSNRHSLFVEIKKFMTINNVTLKLIIRDYNKCGFAWWCN